MFVLSYWLIFQKKQASVKIMSNNTFLIELQVEIPSTSAKEVAPSTSAVIEVAEMAISPHDHDHNYNEKVSVFFVNENISNNTF